MNEKDENTDREDCAIDGRIEDFQARLEAALANCPFEDYPF